MTWSGITHQLHQQLQANIRLEGRRILLLLSGGLDSSVLLDLLIQLKSAHRFELSCLHFHHGGKSFFRQQSLEFCQQLCQSAQVDFHFIKSETELSREDEMRKFRRQQSIDFAKKKGFDLIATAHHADDLLETQLFRVLRGTGLQGLRAINFFESPWLRPLLGFLKSELIEYAQKNNLQFVQDPSNQNLDYDRNWIRHELLPKIEHKKPGSTRHLASFFVQILAATNSQQDQLKQQAKFWVQNGGIPLQEFLSWPKSERLSAIARYLLALGIKDYTQGSLEEILKHLDKSEKRHRFRVAKCEWQLFEHKILAVPRGLES